jgi:hypothetical protein
MLPSSVAAAAAAAGLSKDNFRLQGLKSRL